MGRIAATEDVEGIRDEEQVEETPADAALEDEDAMDTVEEGEQNPEETERSASPQPAKTKTGKYVATVQEVHDAFDTVNVLRYSQPCHLQGMYRSF